MFDTQEATLLCQIDNLDIRASPTSFQSLLSSGVNWGTGCAGTDCTSDATLRQVMNELTLHYAALYSTYAGFAAGGTLSLAQVMQTEHYRNFGPKFAWLYNALDATYGEYLSYKWILNFSGNRTVADLTNMVTSCVSKYQTGTMTWRNLTSADGTRTTLIRQGLRTIPEMASLMQTFMTAGVDVYVVSASLEDAVAAFATNPMFGYNVPRSNVIGMRLAQINGILGTTYAPGWPFVYRPGKVAAIKQAILSQSRYCNQGPIFAAGDTKGDYEMLTAFPATQLRLLVNRLKTGAFGTLCQAAIAQTPAATPTFLLQGRYEAAGTFAPSQSTTLLGATSPQMLP